MSEEPTEEELAEGLASVCPGCYAIGGRCLPGCIDEEIRREAEEEDFDRYYGLARDYDLARDEDDEL